MILRYYWSSSCLGQGSVCSRVSARATQCISPAASAFGSWGYSVELDLQLSSDADVGLHERTRPVIAKMMLRVF